MLTLTDREYARIELEVREDMEAAAIKLGLARTARFGLDTARSWSWTTDYGTGEITVSYELVEKGPAEDEEV